MEVTRVALSYWRKIKRSTNRFGWVRSTKKSLELTHKEIGDTMSIHPGTITSLNGTNIVRHVAVLHSFMEKRRVFFLLYEANQLWPFVWEISLHHSKPYYETKKNVSRTLSRTICNLSSLVCMLMILVEILLWFFKNFIMGSFKKFRFWETLNILSTWMLGSSF